MTQTDNTIRGRDPLAHRSLSSLNSVHVRSTSLKACGEGSENGPTETGLACQKSPRHNPALESLEDVVSGCYSTTGLTNIMNNESIEELKQPWAFERESQSNATSQPTTPDAPRSAFEIELNKRQLVSNLPLDPSTQMSKTKTPFHRWVRTLNRRRVERQRTARLEQGAHHHSTQIPSITSLSDYHRGSSSVSSFAFVAAARDASLSLASTSIKGPSRRHTQHSSKTLSRTDRGSRASFSLRQSEDSQRLSKIQPQVDPAILQRSRRRRQILEELIDTEEGYISDVRFLMNAYMSILASSPSVEADLRSFMSQNLTDIIQLHDELLADLRREVPDMDLANAQRPNTADSQASRRHERWQSLDTVPENKTRSLCLQQVSSVTADPSIARAVAKAFTKKMNRFFVYEEYGARHDAMAKTLEAACSLMSNWETNQRGLETLAYCLNATRDPSNSKKALAIRDLLAKPIQRICRYPLLFSELLKYTPVCDCPDAHSEIDNTLARLREVTGAMNRATGDVKAPVEKTWLLQDRLMFPNQRPNAISKSLIRSLGHIQLCGVLHICWQASTSVQGKYMICLLYRNWLCLAVAETSDRLYTIQACFSLNGCSIENTDNGRGLQCHTAPFSWKLVFECKGQLYEIIMSACTSTEERQWKARFSRHRDANDTCTQPEMVDVTVLALDIKSIATVFGRPGTITRRLSIRRATTVGTKSQLCQVVVKNTTMEKDAPPLPPNDACINRSQSLQTKSRIPVLAPSRSDRARLEILVADVWTRDVLPFPGITGRARRERHMRSSASSLMQRISVASLASTFGKRSIGRASLYRVAAESESQGVTLTPSSQALVTGGEMVDKSSEKDVADYGSRDGSTADSTDKQSAFDKNSQPELPLEQISQQIREQCVAKPKCGHYSRQNLSDASQLTGSLRRTFARIFEESKHDHLDGTARLEDRRSCKEGQGRPKASLDRGSQVYHTFHGRNSVAVCPTTPLGGGSLRCASMTSVGAEPCRSSTLTSHTSALEALAPLTRQHGRGSPTSSVRHWSRRTGFHRGSIRQSFRNLVH